MTSSASCSRFHSTCLVQRYTRQHLKLRYATKMAYGLRCSFVALATALLFGLLTISVDAAAAKSTGKKPKSKSKSAGSRFEDADAATIGLNAAVDKGEVETVLDAIAAGARINEIGNPQTGQTPLMFASLIGEAEIVKILLKAGADPTIGEKDGYTPLHGSAFQGRVEATKVLLAHGNVPNEAHKDGFHPIHRACWGTTSNFADTVQAFLDGGVDPELPALAPADKRAKASAKSITPLEIAKQTGNKDTIRVLEEAIRAKRITAGEPVDDDVVVDGGVKVEMLKEGKKNKKMKKQPNGIDASAGSGQEL